MVEKNLVSELSVPERRLLVDMNGATLPISVQTSLLELNRSGLYYQPAPHSAEDLYIKQMIDKIYTQCMDIVTFAGILTKKSII